MIGKITNEVFSEVYGFINVLGEEYKKKIPLDLYETIEKQKSKNYNPVYDINIPIKNQILKKETLSVIAYLDLKYWCNENERNEIQKKFYKKELQEEQIKRQLYNPDDLFKNKRNNKVELPIEKSLIPYKKEKFLNRLFYKIKSLLKNER